MSECVHMSGSDNESCKGCGMELERSFLNALSSFDVAAWSWC